MSEILHHFAIYSKHPPYRDETAGTYYRRLSKLTGKSTASIKQHIHRHLDKFDTQQTGFAGLREVIAQGNQQTKNEGEGKTTWNIRDDQARVEYEGRQSITSEEQAIAFFNIDTERWVVHRLMHNAWDVSTSDGQTYTNYQTKVWLKPKEETLAKVKANLLAEVPRAKLRTITPTRAKIALEMMITDLHMGKVGFNPDTMELNWSPEQAAQVYADAIQHFVSRAPGPIDHIILPTGNDMLNIDSDANMTKRGTPQMTGEFFQNLFSFTRRMVCATVEMLSQDVAPVHIVLVPGNHDESSMFHLGEALQARYEDSKHITIDNRPIRRKSYEWGTNLISWDHGHNFKMGQAYKVLSQDDPAAFARTHHRALHMGHMHKNCKHTHVSLTQKDEDAGIEVEICPALTPTDAWHYKNLYIGNLRRAKSFVYHRKEGKVAEHYFNLNQR